MRTFPETHVRRFQYFSSALCIFIGISAFPIKAQDISTDPASLFGYSRPDSRVNLFVDGSWETGAALQLGLRKVSSEDNTGNWGFDQVQLPGFAPATLSNVVDLTLSLRLDDRYYFETVFLDEFELDSILFGYDGQGDELIQRFRVGLGPIAIDNYPGLPTGRAGDSVAGSDIRLETPRSVSEAMLRYVRSQPEVLRVQGGDEITSTRIGSLNYLRGQRFVLPERPLTTLRVFVESDSGIMAADGRRYRELDPDREAVVSLSLGTVRLNEPPRGRVLAVYRTENGSEAGDDGTGRDFVVPVTETGFVSATAIDSAASRFDATRANLGFVSAGGEELPEESSRGDDFLSRTGRTSGDAAQDAMFVELEDTWAALLYEPEYFSPFERLDAYPLSRTAEPGSFPETRLVQGSGDAEFIPPRAVPERFSSEGDLLLFGSLNPDDPAARYPFGDFASLYGWSAQPDLRADLVPFDIQLETSDRIEEVRLPSGAIAGSVTMTRNGVPDSRFEVGDDGTIRLTSPALAQDVLEFRYRNSDSEGASSTLEAVAGSRFALSERSNLTAGIRYTRDLPEADFTTRSNEAVAETEGVLSWRFTGERVHAGILADFTATRSDTTGVRRLIDIDATRTPLPVVPWRSLPGAEPEEAREILDANSTELIGPGGSVEDRTPWSGSRGRLLFRDYLDDAGFLPYGTELESDRIYDWGDGSFTGPYVASLPDGSSENSADRAMVIDYQLDAAGDWVSAQLQVGPDGVSETPGGVRFRLRALDIDGPVDVYVQSGATSEDLDADGVSDRGSGPTDPDFSFEHSPSVTLRAGGKPFADASGEPAREDILRRGFIALEDVNRIVTRQILEDVESPEAHDFVIQFTREEIARMGAPRALRFIVVGTGDPDGPARGALLVSNIELLSRPLTSRRVDSDGTETAGSGSASSIPESGVRVEGDTELPADRFLSEVFPQRTVFSDPASDPPENRVLAVRGGGNAGVSVSARHNPARLSEYGVFAFFVHTGTVPAPGPVRFELSSGAESRSAIDASIEVPVDANWQRIEVDTITGDVTRVYLGPGDSGELEREPVGRATLNPDLDIQSTVIAVYPHDSIPEWTVYIDEPHLSESRSRLTGDVTGDFSYQGPDEWFTTAGGLRIGNLQAHVTGGLSSSVFDGSKMDIAAETLRIDAQGGVVLGNLAISLNTDWNFLPQFNEHTLLLGHGLATDAPWYGLRIEEVYTRNLTSAGRDVEDHELISGYEAGIWESVLHMQRSIRGDRREHRQAASFSIPHVAGGIELSQTASDASVIADQPYFASWINSFRAFAPEALAEPDRRSGTAVLDFSLGPRPVDANLGFDSAWTALPASPQLNADSGVRVSADLEAFGDTGVLLSPFYERRVAITEEGEPISEYRDDVSRIAASLGPEERVLYVSIPFVELLADQAPRVFSLMENVRTSTRYTPSTGLEFSRPLQTRLGDLFLPYRAVVEMSRDFTTESSSTTSTGRLNAELNARAVNLFGSLGAYPLTSWFRSDEYDTRFRIGFDYGETLRDRVQHQYQTVLDWRVFPGPETDVSLFSETTVDRGERNGYDHSTRLRSSIDHAARLADALPVPISYEQSTVRSEHDVSMRVARTDEPLDILSLTGGTRVTALYDSTLRLTLGARLGYEITGFRTMSMATSEHIGIEIRFTGRLRF